VGSRAAQRPERAANVRARQHAHRVVAHGKGIGLLLGKNAAANPTLKKMIQSLYTQGVVFAACNNTLKRMNIPKSDLLQVAKALRGDDFVEVCIEMDEQNKRQLAWLNTQMQHRAPHTLTVPA